MIDDLLWILKTPSLVGVDDDKVISGVDWLNAAERISSVEPVMGNPTSTRLGLYYENLVNLLINKRIQPIELKRNIQVIKNLITIGEYDFLGRVDAYDFHLECAIKFYLCVGDGGQLSDFIGPNKRDRLAIKYQRMRDHQLQLSETSAGQATCKALNIHPTKKIMLLQGYLFYHLDQAASTLQLAAEINPLHQKGWWIRQNEYRKLSDQFNYAVLQKPYWLSPRPEKLATYHEFIKGICHYDRPQLICRFDKITGNEVDRGFIVPNLW